jgi:hypothetical protein
MFWKPTKWQLFRCCEDDLVADFCIKPRSLVSLYNAIAKYFYEEKHSIARCHIMYLTLPATILGL